MIDACVVWPNGNGGAGTARYAKGFDSSQADIDELVRRHVPPGVPHFVTTAPEFKAIVGDRTFREAWCLDNATAPTVIKVNMPKARSIHMDRIRQARNHELTRLDPEWMKAIEIQNTALANQIAAQKQSLRDIPQTFDLAKYRTPATLKAAWPSKLPRPIVSEVEP